MFHTIIKSDKASYISMKDDLSGIIEYTFIKKERNKKSKNFIPSPILRGYQHWDIRNNHVSSLLKNYKFVSLCEF